MKCQACDEILSDFEATRKQIETNQYLELCNHCFDDDILTLDRTDLMHATDEKPGLEFERLDQNDYDSLGVTDVYFND
jgi:hypothetical protein